MLIGASAKDSDLGGLALPPSLTASNGYIVIQHPLIGKKLQPISRCLWRAIGDAQL